MPVKKSKYLEVRAMIKIYISPGEVSSIWVGTGNLEFLQNTDFVGNS